MLINEAKKHLNATLPEKYRIIDFYNANCIQHVKASRKYKVKYSDNWCATFTSFVAKKVGLTSSQFPYECGVQEQVKLAKLRGQFYTDVNKVKPNDLIVYDWDSNAWADHVGIVIERSEGTIKVIEGNIKNTVGYRTLSENSKSIQGFISVGVVNPSEPKKLTKGEERERIADLAQETVAGKYGNGSQRVKLLGADYGAVQEYINNYYR